MLYFLHTHCSHMSSCDKNIELLLNYIFDLTRYLLRYHRMIATEYSLFTWASKITLIFHNKFFDDVFLLMQKLRTTTIGFGLQQNTSKHREYKVASFFSAYYIFSVEMQLESFISTYIEKEKSVRNASILHLWYFVTQTFYVEIYFVYRAPPYTKAPLAWKCFRVSLFMM